jgi:hypothetical protein
MSDGPEALQPVGAIVSKQHVRDELTDVFRDFTPAPHDDKYGVSSNSSVDRVGPVPPCLCRGILKTNTTGPEDRRTRTG